MTSITLFEETRKPLFSSPLLYGALYQRCCNQAPLFISLSVLKKRNDNFDVVVVLQLEYSLLYPRQVMDG
jgi:hypothetical protein